MNAKATVVTRNEMILSYHSLVCSIANKLVRRLPDTIDVQELISVGMIGLIESYDRFDQEKGIPFVSYAELRIRGAMIDELRRQDWVPRSLRKRVQEQQNLRTWMEAKYKRKIHDHELAKELNMTPVAFERQQKRNHILQLVSMESSLQNTATLSIKDQLCSMRNNPEEELCENEFQMSLSKAIEQLAEREKKTINWYYFQKKSLRSIGDLLGVTESRACQIRGEAMRKLQKMMAQLSLLH